MPPNILWYCTDQQRFDTVGALGNPHVETPTFDRLAGEGVAFTHAYCQSPICTPSRASFMTGLYPSRVHNCRNGNESFPNHPPLVSKLIAEAGYDCGLIGKFHLQSAGRRAEPRLDDGFRYWKFSHAPRDDWPDGHDYAEWVRERGGDLDAMRTSPDRVPPELHQTAWASERAIEFINERRAGPWMLNVNVYDPHPPFIPPRTFAERFNPAAMPGPHFRESDLEQQRRLGEIDFQTCASHPDEFDGRRVQALYYAMIAQIDEQLGRLVDVLEQTGQRDHTLIVVSSDHGEALGDHGLLYKGCRFYEGLVRVPLIFSWPGRFACGLTSEALVELLDLSATLIDVAGVERPEWFQGWSLLPILRGESPAGWHREFVRSEYFDALDQAFTGGGSPDVPGERDSRRPPAPSPFADARPFPEATGSYGTMYRDRRYKLCVYHGHAEGELYDLDADPWEHENLWHSPAHEPLKQELLKASFDATMLLTVDVGTRRIAPM